MSTKFLSNYPYFVFYSYLIWYYNRFISCVIQTIQPRILLSRQFVSLDNKTNIAFVFRFRICFARRRGRIESRICGRRVAASRRCHRRHRWFHWDITLTLPYATERYSFTIAIANLGFLRNVIRFHILV